MSRLPVATGSNRTNSGGASLGTVKNRTSVTINTRVEAGDVLPLPAAGTQFYLIISNGMIGIRPSGGVFNEYQPGTGLQLLEVNAFDLLEVRNSNAFPVVFSLFIGFDEYIDKTLILNQTTANLVAFPTYSIPNAAANVDIDDISGQAFTDINGNEWYALSREGIYIGNIDSGVTLFLQEAGSVIANGPAIMPIYPLTSLRFPAGGDFCLNVGGGNINCIVSEVYNAIPKTN